jgi:hypothetical protein
LDLVANSAKQTITFTQANGICQTYMNAYLNKSQQRRSFLLKNNLDTILDGCVADVMYTGDAQVSLLE